MSDLETRCEPERAPCEIRPLIARVSGVGRARLQVRRIHVLLDHAPCAVAAVEPAGRVGRIADDRIDALGELREHEQRVAMIERDSVALEVGLAGLHRPALRVPRRTADAIHRRQSRRSIPRDRASSAADASR